MVKTKKSKNITIGMVRKLAKEHNLELSGPTKCTMDGFGDRVGWHFWAFETVVKHSTSTTYHYTDKILFHFWPNKKSVLEAMYNVLKLLLK